MEVKSLRQELEEMGEAVIQTVGISMEPLLHARESTVLVRRAAGPYRKNDVVLYIRPDGRYVLHRLVQAGPEWLTQGDHQLCKEKISEDWIIGVMEGFHTRPDSPYRSVRSGSYRLYVLGLPLRRLWLRVRGCAGRIRRSMEENQDEVRKG